MSTAQKHTPGPWHWRLSANATVHIEHGDCLPDEIGMLKNRVCVMPAEIMHDYNSLANARLIAAAPEMLEALKGATYALETLQASESGMLYTFMDETIRDALAAIAKAEGNQV
jgi:hypothetical protein